MSGLNDQASFEREHLWATDHMSDYLDRDLAAASLERIRRHLDDCALCRELLEGLRRTVDALQRLSSPGGEVGPAEIASRVAVRIDEQA